MKVKIEGRLVEVLDKDCKNRPCFRLGFDKGSFTPGRGYTSYHKDAKGRTVEYPVCFTRHLRGCPTNSVCPLCRMASVRDPGATCGSYWGENGSPCKGVLVALESGSKQD